MTFRLAISTALGFLLLTTAASATQDEAAALARLLRKIRNRVSKSVVAVEVDRISDPQGKTGSGSHGTHQDYYNRPAGPTTGTVIDKKGYVLTSYFNVSGKVRGITVTVWDGKTYPAKLLGFDQKRDIALLKIDREDLPPLPIAATYEQGDFVLIVGRSPDKLRPTVNHGILSATRRRKGTAVQTDAELNYGNVGGPLLTLKGEMIGVTCHIRPREPWGQSSGVGFATRASEIQRLLPALKAKRKIVEAKRAYMGVQPGEGVPNIEGAHIGAIVPGSPAEKAGIRANDVVVRFDKKPVADFESLRKLVSAKKIGDKVKIEVKRKIKGKWKSKMLTLTLEALPRGN